MLFEFDSVIEVHTGDPLSTASGVHVSGTELQSESPNLFAFVPCHDCVDRGERYTLWHQIRALRITGTSFKNYATSDPKKLAASLWAEKPDLSHLKSIQWGREKEDEARRDYQRQTGSNVTCCGIFVSRENSLFAASPDGIVNGILLEIKCPYSIRDIDLNLSKVAHKCSFLDKDLRLRRTHTYFYQIQLGMFVTGCRETHFVV